MRVAPRRTGFTLLEVILSTSIAVLLLTAVYVAVDTQYRHAEAARNVVEQSTLARSLLTRITNDISSSLGPTDPSRFRATSSQGGGQTGQGGTQTGTGQTGQANGTTPQQPSAAQPMGGVASSNFIFTIKGDSETMSIFVTRVNRELYQDNEDAAMQVVSDIRRISYWLASGPPAGLARQEIKIATSDEIDLMPSDIADEGSYVLAPEVQSLEFSYWDGNGWQDSWDGGATGSDGVTPIGPPLAIAVKIGLPKNPGVATQNAGEPELKYYRHVIAILTANAASQVTNDGTMP